MFQLHFVSVVELIHLLLLLLQLRISKNIHTFSVIDKDARYDESANISKVVNHLKCESSFIETSSENFLTNLEKIISYYQSPVPTVSYYIHNQLIKKIKESGFSVAISGTGADEIFTGYYDHYNFWLQMMTSEPNFEKLRDEWKKGYGRKVNNPLIKNITQFIENQNYREHLYQNSKDFNKILIDKIDVKFEEIKYSSDNLRNRMINELNHEIVPTILYSDDLNSMMHSIENRSPFLDKELVEFISSVDSSFLIKNGLAKFILRESMKNLLPKKIIFNKEKVGFNASILSFINLKNKNIVDWLLQESIFEVVNKKKFISLLNKDFSKNYFSKFLFNFISSKIFLERKFIFKMKTLLPLVTVYVVNHNYGKYLDQAVESILSQTFQDFELILIDNGSTDNSKEKLKKYSSDKKIKIIYQDNIGLNSANNVALNFARGEVYY